MHGVVLNPCCAAHGQSRVGSVLSVHRWLSWFSVLLVCEDKNRGQSRSNVTFKLSVISKNSNKCRITMAEGEWMKLESFFAVVEIRVAGCPDWAMDPNRRINYGPCLPRPPTS